MLRARNRRGDSERAAELLGQALEAAEAHGCANLARRVRDAINQPTAAAS
jgi:hypothetical protein